MSDELILDKIEAMLPYFTKSELKVAKLHKKNKCCIFNKIVLQYF